MSERYAKADTAEIREAVGRLQIAAKLRQETSGQFKLAVFVDDASAKSFTEAYYRIKSAFGSTAHKAAMPISLDTLFMKPQAFGYKAEIGFSVDKDPGRAAKVILGAFYIEGVRFTS